MRILITGAAGQVGTELTEHCVKSGDEVLAVTRAEADLGDPVATIELVGSFRPHSVIHCAAWTAVDDNESDPARAMRDNADAVANVARASDRIGAHLVHLSTDYVFDGTKASPYLEDDATNPLSMYGRSKLAGEHHALGVGACVVRTSWVCGRFGPNMVRTICRLANERPALAFVDDQRGHPTIVADLVPMLRLLAEHRRHGIHHVTNQGPVSWYEFAREVMAAAGHDPDRVSPISTAELRPPRPAPRPANSVLANAALAAAGIDLLPDFRESLVALVAELAGPATR